MPATTRDRKPDSRRVGAKPSVENLLYEGERVRLAAAARELRRRLRGCGATIAFASDPKVTQLVLAQAELVRTGRSSAV